MLHCIAIPNLFTEHHTGSLRLSGCFVNITFTLIISKDRVIYLGDRIVLERTQRNARPIYQTASNGC